MPTSNNSSSSSKADRPRSRNSKNLSILVERKLEVFSENPFVEDPPESANEMDLITPKAFNRSFTFHTLAEPATRRSSAAESDGSDEPNPKQYLYDLMGMSSAEIASYELLGSISAAEFQKTLDSVNVYGRVPASERSSPDRNENQPKASMSGGSTHDTESRKTSFSDATPSMNDPKIRELQRFLKKEVFPKDKHPENHSRSKVSITAFSPCLVLVERPLREPIC